MSVRAPMSATSMHAAVRSAHGSFVSQPVIAKLNEQVQALLKSPDTQKQLTELSLEVVGGSAADFVSFARKESGDYAKFVKDFNITPQ